MNTWLILAEAMHLLSFILLYWKIHTTRNCIGISYRTQELYLIVFLTRYCDLFTYYELIDTILKPVYIVSTLALIYNIKFKKPMCLTYQPDADNFPHYTYLYTVATVLTVICHTGSSVFHLSQSYSIWLEALAIIPQLHLMRKISEVENLTNNYVFCLGVYRLLYIISWFCKVIHAGWWCWTSIGGGVLATVVYSDFLYLFIRNRGQIKVAV